MKIGLYVQGVICGLIGAAVLVPTAAVADSLVPGPGEASHDVILAERVRLAERQFFEFNARPFGSSLDCNVPNAADRALVDNWIVSAADFQTFSGKHPFEVISSYGEYGDLGMFGGFAGAGTAWRYRVLRDSGADPQLLAVARQRILRDLDTWHIFTAITGVSGLFARGIRRIEPDEVDAPPIPGDMPELIPLFDTGGEPLPTVKHKSWRADNSGSLPDWIWEDETSKDQASGYFFVLGALWDAIADDPTIPQSYRDRMQADARKLAQALMTKHTLGEPPLDQDVDMLIMDADGRLVTYYALNPRVISEDDEYVVPEDWSVKNSFNALLGLGAIKVTHHITGDAEIGSFYYDELIDNRDWHTDVAESGIAGLEDIYALGPQTNFSNVNMAAVSLLNILRYEGDPALRDHFAVVLKSDFYKPGTDRQAGGLKQPFFDLLFAGLKKNGTNETAVNDALETFDEWPTAPTWHVSTINCDAAEISAGSCVAIDGTTVITLEDGPGWSEDDVATEPVPMRLRPRTNFQWRSDPHRVNSNGGSRLNPPGDFIGAYWLGRLLQRSGTNDENLSPFARDRSNLVVGGGVVLTEDPPDPDGGPPDGGLGADDGNGGDSGYPGDLGAASGDGASPSSPGDGADSRPGSGCDCAASSRHGLMPLSVLAVLSRWRRRRPS